MKPSLFALTLLPVAMLHLADASTARAESAVLLMDAELPKVREVIVNAIGERYLLAEIPPGTSMPSDDDSVVATLSQMRAMGLAQVVVVAAVSKQKRKVTLRLRIAGGEPPTVVFNEQVTAMTTVRRGRKTRTKVQNQDVRTAVLKGIEKLTGRASAAPEPAPAPAPTSEPPAQEIVAAPAAPEPAAVAEPEPKPQPATVPPPPPSTEATAGTPLAKNPGAVSLKVGVSYGGRSFSYSNFQTGGLRNYSQTALALVGVEASLWPFRIKPGLPLQGFWVDGAFRTSLGASADVDGETGLRLNVEWLESRIGLGYAIVPTDILEISLGAYFDYLSFTFSTSSADPRADEAPNATYLSITPEFRVKLRFNRFDVAATGAFIGNLSSGELTDAFFPRAKVLGGTARVIGTFHVNETIALSLDGQYVHYSYSMNSQPGDAFIADGATDIFYRAGGNLVVKLWPSTR